MPGERVVWKYPFPPGEDRLDLDVPESSRLVLFAAQGPTLAVWIERPVRHEDVVTRSFLIVGTGHPTPSADWRHAGSTLVDGGAFVFHLYERIPS